MHGPKANQSDDCNLDAFIDPAVLDRSDAILFEYQQSHHRTRPDLPLILGETATAGQGLRPFAPALLHDMTFPAFDAAVAQEMEAATILATAL